MANVGSLIPALLVMLFLGAILGGTGMALLILSCRRRQLAAEESFTPEFKDFKEIAIALNPTFPRRPTTWLAVRSRNVHAVQMALGLNNAQPCTWTEGMSGDEKLFIAPPVRG